MPVTALTARIGVLLLAATLAGCGFHLRGSMPGSTKDKTFIVTGASSRNPVYASFATALQTAGGSITKNPAQASGIIEIVRTKQIRRPITLSAAGRANTFDLRLLVIYEVSDAKGNILIPERELEIQREYFNTQSSPLGQGLEEVQIRAEMEKEAGQALVRQVVYSLENRPAKAP